MSGRDPVIVVQTLEARPAALGDVLLVADKKAPATKAFAALGAAGTSAMRLAVDGATGPAVLSMSLRGVENAPAATDVPPVEVQLWPGEIIVRSKGEIIGHSLGEVPGGTRDVTVVQP